MLPFRDSGNVPTPEAALQQAILLAFLYGNEEGYFHDCLAADGGWTVDRFVWPSGTFYPAFAIAHKGTQYSIWLCGVDSPVNVAPVVYGFLAGGPIGYFFSNDNIVVKLEARNIWEIALKPILDAGNASSLWLAGHSWGGMIAQELYMFAREQLDNVSYRPTMVMGSPKQFVRGFDAGPIQNTNWTTTNDFVVYLPPRDFNYVLFAGLPQLPAPAFLAPEYGQLSSFQQVSQDGSIFTRSADSFRDWPFPNPLSPGNIPSDLVHRITTYVQYLRASSPLLTPTTITMLSIYDASYTDPDATAAAIAQLAQADLVAPVSRTSGPPLNPIVLTPFSPTQHDP